MRKYLIGSVFFLSLIISDANANSLVSVARSYIGTNPIGKAHVWCGDFANLALRKAGYRPHRSNYTLDFVKYGRRVPGPVIGALAIMYRSGGGHIGVVSDIGARTVTLISGNNKGRPGRRVVGEGEYPRSRISFYVVPE